MSHLYILSSHNIPIPCENTLKWAKWFQDNHTRRIVKHTRIKGVLISTVFLGANHSFGDGPPTLFETMIFDGEHHGHQERCSTWEEAETEHRIAVDLVEGKK